MQSRTLLLTPLVILMVACAGDPPRPDGPAGGAGGSQPPAAEPAGANPPAENGASDQPMPVASKRPVPMEVLYNVLAGEIAGQNEDYATAAHYYLEASLESADPAIAERATQIALYAGNTDLAGRAVKRLIEIAPESRRAYRTAATLAVEEGEPLMARRYLEHLMTMASTPEAGWQEVARLMARASDESFALDLMGELVEAHPEQAPAWRARSQLASHFDRLQPALDYADRALELNPEAPELLAWRGRLRLSDADYEGAAADLEKALEAAPDNRQAQLNFAEALRRQGDYDRAQSVLSGLPQNPELVKTRAALALENEDWELAGELYRRLLDEPGFNQEALYFLGQLAELEKRFEEALSLYEQVDSDELRLDADVRRAVVLAQQERLDEALEVLAGLKSGDRGAVEEAFLAEGQILTDAGRIDDALAAYREGLNRLPSSQRLVYARGLLAAEQGRLELAEADFRAILDENPEDAMALNALGYTLADQTDRLDEAHDLISRAYELVPDDAAVVDSLGWVEYRRGNHQEALVHLRRALDLQFDAEIAAHLGEVLWVTGEKEEAREIWRRALERLPEDSEVVRRTMERLTP